MTPTLFIGAGNMAAAMIAGWARANPGKTREIVVCSRTGESARRLAAQHDLRFTENPGAALKEVRSVVLACKPQQIGDLAPALAPAISGKTVLSILAGTRLERLRSLFPEAGTLVRAMPNRPGQIAQGITPYAVSAPLSPAGQAWVDGLLGAMGDAFPVPEEHLDAVTGVSGSGPAYVFEFIAALRDGGIAEGLEAGTAQRLALQTVRGAAALLAASGQSPESERDAVVSPNGTTAAALASLGRSGFRESIIEAVRAATRRSRELSAS